MLNVGPYKPQELTQTQIYEDLSEIIKIFKSFLTLLDIIAFKTHRMEDNQQSIQQLKQSLKNIQGFIKFYNFNLPNESQHKNTFHRFICRIMQVISAYKVRFQLVPYFKQVKVPIKQIQMGTLQYQNQKNIGLILRNIQTSLIRFCCSKQKKNNKNVEKNECQISYDYSINKLNQNGNNSQRFNLNIQKAKQRRISFSKSDNNINKLMIQMNKKYKLLNSLDLDFNYFKQSFFQSKDSKQQFYLDYFERNQNIYRQIIAYSKSFSQYLKRRQQKKSIFRRNKFLQPNFNPKKQNHQSYLNFTKKKSFLDNKNIILDNKSPFLDSKSPFLDNKSSFLENKPPFLDRNPSFLDSDPPFLDSNPPFLDKKTLFDYRKTFLDSRQSFYKQNYSQIPKAQNQTTLRNLSQIVYNDTKYIYKDLDKNENQEQIKKSQRQNLFISKMVFRNTFNNYEIESPNQLSKRKKNLQLKKVDISLNTHSIQVQRAKLNSDKSSLRKIIQPLRRANNFCENQSQNKLQQINQKQQIQCKEKSNQIFQSQDQNQKLETFQSKNLNTPHRRKYLIKAPSKKNSTEENSEKKKKKRINVRHFKRISLDQLQKLSNLSQQMCAVRSIKISLKQS